MAWVAVDKDETEWVYDEKPAREEEHGIWSVYWTETNDIICIHLPKGSIQKLIGKELTWEDEPVELKEIKRYER